MIREGEVIDETKDQPVKKDNKKKIINLVFIGFSIIALGFAGGWVGARSYIKNPNTFSQETNQARKTVIDQSELISSIAKEVGPSVVSINVTSGGRVSDSFFGPGAVERQSAGTGFILSKDGYVVTNRHVIDKSASSVSIVMSDGKVYPDVEVIGRTSEGDPLDIAFLKIKNLKGAELKPAKIGVSDKMNVGDAAIAIGNALGQFQNTVTSGIISGYGRSVQAESGAGNVESLNNLFQTDAAINQGNSGGPLVNSNGEVIGINTAVAGDGAENIGFAIPIDDVKGLIKSVLKNNKLERPYIGVRYVQLSEEVAKKFDLKTNQGAYIPPEDATRNEGSSIVKGSPAEKAGLKEKDIITKINGKDINKDNGLASAIGKFSVGDTIELTIVRDGREINMNLKLEALR